MCDELAVVIPTRRPTFALKACLGSLTQQWPQHVKADIVVVDDGSGADYGMHIEGWDPDVRLVRLDTQQGAGPARNAGVNATHAEWIVFLDDDCTVPWEWTDSIIAFVKNNANVSMAGGGIKSKFPRNWFSQATEDFVLRSRISPSGDPRIVTACALVNRQDFLKLGGFDSRFTNAGGEDWDLSERMNRAGYALEITDDFFCYHSNPRTLRGFAERAWRYGKTSVLLASPSTEPRVPRSKAEALVRRLVSAPLRVWGFLARLVNLCKGETFWRRQRGRLLFVTFQIIYRLGRWSAVAHRG